MRGLAQTYRAKIVDLLRELGPDAPTLCDGWTTADLAAHLYVRENDPVAMPGIVVSRLADLTQRRQDNALAKLGYDGILDAFAAGPKPWSLFAIPAVHKNANGLELYVHYEDIVRAQDDYTSSDPLPAGLVDECWSRVSTMGKMLARSCPVGLQLERADGPSQRAVMTTGDQIVTVRGLPGEIAMWLFGRTAEVELIGDPKPVSLAVQAVTSGI